MIDNAVTQLIIHIPTRLHGALHARSAAHGKTVETYATEALMELIQDPVEDKMWGEMSEAAKTEGVISVEDSEILLNELKYA